MGQIAQGRYIGDYIMHKEVLFQKKVNALTFLLFFIAMFILVFMQWLPVWAAAMAAAFVAVTLRQFMVGKIIDIFVSLIIFGLLFISNTYYISELATGILLIVGAGYAFIRECFEIYTYKLKRIQKTEEPEDFYSEDDEDPKD